MPKLIDDGRGLPAIGVARRAGNWHAIGRRFAALNHIGLRLLGLIVRTLDLIDDKRGVAPES